jgi:hypothetical protein
MGLRGQDGLLRAAIPRACTSVARRLTGTVIAAPEISRFSLWWEKG